ncbi:hypothetical protein SGL43_06576 [Streptomyces globisporus]|uniref:Uncharacterized protein n=1 Tax=Streptomyces globisporus TaxID=1908 RepID=A0ABM9H7A0_STRGL|nr:hypothetical protein [Streptomyces globisporus]CAH9419521.1 hypothetical protein SGL43_06576 [Streptomyces globisporus]
MATGKPRNPWRVIITGPNVKAALDDQPSPPDHSECIGPHLAPDGEHIDCDGNPL